MEEYDFFAEMCLIALDISKEVKFAAVIDSNGKLITGKQCRNSHYHINNSLVLTRLLQTATSTSSVKENHQDSHNAYTTFCGYNTSYLFYAHYLTPYIEENKK